MAGISDRVIDARAQANMCCTDFWTRRGRFFIHSQDVFGHGL